MLIRIRLDNRSSPPCEMQNSLASYSLAAYCNMKNCRCNDIGLKNRCSALKNEAESIELVVESIEHEAELMERIDLAKER